MRFYCKNLAKMYKGEKCGDMNVHEYMLIVGIAGRAIPTDKKSSKNVLIILIDFRDNPAKNNSSILIKDCILKKISSLQNISN